MTRPGAPSRHAEVGAVADRLGEHYHLEVMAEPATLDGGDVLRWGRHLCVGLSRRTNRAGIAHLEAVARKDGFAVEIVPVFAGLHLKSSCTLADQTTLVYQQQTIDVAAFRAAGLDCVPVTEPLGANVLALGTFVLVSDGAPQTADMLRRRGLTVRAVDVGELHKGDGALTCLSLRMARGGHWVA
jgi:dimethylargininase